MNPVPEGALCPEHPGPIGIEQISKAGSAYLSGSGDSTSLEVQTCQLSFGHGEDTCSRWQKGREGNFYLLPCFTALLRGSPLLGLMVALLANSTPNHPCSKGE